MSALSQFFLVAWLSPADFGLFAGANSALIVILALTNLGEVNAFLTGRVSHAADLLRTTFVVNWTLASVGVVVALALLLLDLVPFAAMVALVALTIPFSGSALSWNAVAIRAEDLRTAITGQFAGASVRLVTGVAIAAATEWAYALPLALMAGSAANSATTRRMLKIRPPRPSRDSAAPLPRTLLDRARWAGQSLVQFFGAQVDYLVIALLATPYTLGLYFLAYQATVGISTLVSGPLMKSGLVELGKSHGRDLSTTRELAAITSISATGICAVAAAAVMALSPYFPGDWSAAGAPLVMLLGSLTGRLLTPVLEAQLLASDQVSRSFWINGADVVGTTVAASVVLTGDILLVALAVSVWKVTVSGLRCLAVFNLGGILVVLPAIVSLAAHAALSFGAAQGSLLGASALFTSGVLVVAVSQVVRRAAR